MALLEVEDLRVGYGFPVLIGISFEVEEGETCVLFGLNGAGKTTTVATIAGLLKPDGGSIRFDGDEIGGRGPDLARAIAASPSSPRAGGCSRRSACRTTCASGVDATARPGPGRGAARARLRVLPPPGRTPGPGGGHAVRRRAADAGDRPGAHVEAQAAADRRGVARAQPGAGQDRVRGRQADQRRRRHRGHRRAERRRAAVRRPGADHGEGHAHLPGVGDEIQSANLRETYLGGDH